MVGDFSVKNASMKVEASKKKTLHVPKFMLELYEKNRIEGMNEEQPDVVRSLIPSHAGELSFF